MYPIICRIGPFTVYSYGLMLVVAFALSVWLAMDKAKKLGIARDTVFNLAFAAFIWGIVGARVFYVAENARYYIKAPWEVFMLQRGGLSWFGGLIGGTAAGLFYLRRRNLAVYAMLDLLSPFVALAQSIGRLGCLLNGCCFGAESAFGFYFPTHSAVLAPVQLYSSALLLAIFAILRFAQERSHRKGEIFFLYLLLYSFKRFFIEFWRADNPAVFAGLTLFQLLSAAIFSLALTKLIITRNAIRH